MLAIDIPSGLTADTGTVNGCAVRATHTLSFLGAKPGLYTGDGPDYCGTVVIEALGTAPAKSSGILVAPEDFALAARPRAKNSNKGQFGNLGVLAGAQGMVGAGLLCSRTALYAGAGRVYVQLPGNDAPAVDWLHPELMFRSDLGGIKLTAAVAGPGLGEPPAARSALENLIDAPIALVLDADALNAIAKDPSLTARVKERSAPKILTPHPLEAARLLHADVARVERDRIGAALELARSLDAHVVVKGAGSVLARPDGAWAINPTGNPALASAGTGDVLSGLLGGLLAQGWDIWSALMGAVWIHGRAADQLVLTGHGPVGLTASELMPAIRLEINRLVSAH